MNIDAILPPPRVFRWLIFSPLPLAVCFYLAVMPLFGATRDQPAGTVVAGVMFAFLGVVFVLLPLYLLMTSGVFMARGQEKLFAGLGLFFNISWFALLTLAVLVGPRV